MYDNFEKTKIEDFWKMDELFMNDKISEEELKKYMDEIEEKQQQPPKVKVRDHCHYTGKYRGAACSSCNSKMKKPKFVPVIFHNLQNYDSHLFIKNLGVSEGEINCIPNTEEKYISFTKEIIVDKFESKKIITEKQFQSKCKENIIEYEEFNNEKGEIEYKIKEMINVKKQIRFIDSFKFMQQSLSGLVKNLDKNEGFNIMKKFYKNEEER